MLPLDRADRLLPRAQEGHAADGALPPAGGHLAEGQDGAVQDGAGVPPRYRAGHHAGDH